MNYRNPNTCLLLYFYIFFTVTSALTAQSPEKRDDSPAKGRLAWFIITSIPDDLENPVTVMSGEKTIDLTLSKRSPSDPVKIPSDRILRIIRPSEGPKKPDKPSFTTLAQAKIPQGTHQALVVLIPHTKPNGDLRFYTKIVDLSEYRGADWLFINLTNLKIQIDMGETNIPVKPGSTKIYAAPNRAKAKAVSMPIRYTYYHPDEQKWKLLSASTIVLRSTRREICIFSIHPQFKRIAYHGITFPVTEK